MRLTVSHKEMADFFNNWTDKIKEMLDMEEIKSIINIDNASYFFARNIEKDYDAMLKNLHLIFGEDENVDQQVAIFDETLDFLHQIVQVEGADRLFNKHFYGMGYVS